MNSDCLEFVNNHCSTVGVVKLFGIKRVNGQVFGLINEKDLEMFWRPKNQLCEIHETWIDAWINLGGDIA